MKKQLLFIATFLLSGLALTVFAEDKANGVTAEKNYQTICFSCHNSGIAGSPKLGDAAAWKERIATGKEAMYANVIKGFTGKTGTMPPRGASQFKDDELNAIVDYMVSKVEGSDAKKPEAK